MSDSSSIWLVEVDSGTGNGTLRLDLTSTDGITPPITNVLFIGEEYTIDRTLPDDPKDPAYRTENAVYLPLVQL